MEKCEFEGCFNPVFSGGYCKFHQWARPDWGNIADKYRIKSTKKDIKRKRPIHDRFNTLDKELLTFKSASYRAYLHWGGANFLTGEKMILWTLKPSNFAHVLNKKNHKFFEFYERNIVLLSNRQHYILDHGTLRDVIKSVWAGNETKEDWKMLFNYRAQLKSEYEKWCKTNFKEYKIFA